MFETSTLFSQFGFGSFNNRHFMNEQIQDSPEISGIRFTMYVLPFAISQTLAWASCDSVSGIVLAVCVPPPVRCTVRCGTSGK